MSFDFRFLPKIEGVKNVATEEIKEYAKISHAKLVGISNQLDDIL